VIRGFDWGRGLPRDGSVRYRPQPIISLLGLGETWTGSDAVLAVDYWRQGSQEVLVVLPNLPLVGVNGRFD
jgi:hypothetical protein